MTIKELKALLRLVEKEAGTNAEVYLSTDSEGNGFGTTDLKNNYWQTGMLVLYPFKEYVDLKFNK